MVFFAIISNTHPSAAVQTTQKLVLNIPYQGVTEAGNKTVQLGSKYRAGQLLFKISFESEKPSLQEKKTVLKVTTCSSHTSFDTVLFAFDSNPIPSPEINSERISPVDFNDNDCGLQSTIELQVVSSSIIYIIVTGHYMEHGKFELLATLERPHNANIIPWGLDRIDQRSLPLNGIYSVRNGGTGVFVYILDSGLRTTHTEFLAGDGSSRAVFGTDLVDRLPYSFDATGHGTHVAATVGGNRFGVAKRVTLISVRVLDRNGVGFTARLIEGLEWTLSDIQSKNRRPAIVVMSLSTPFSKTLNQAVKEVTETSISVVTAAGNRRFDSCSFSPASEESTITVAATNIHDKRPDYSNFGGCVNIYAPGNDILSASATGDFAVRNLSGTSAACPHVAGTVAVLLGDNPSLSPREVSSVIYSTATYSAVENHMPAEHDSTNQFEANLDRTNRLVYVRPVPNLSDGTKPKAGQMFVYSVLIFDHFSKNAARPVRSTCVISSTAREEMDELVQDTVSTKRSDIVASVKTTLCCPGKTTSGCDGIETRSASMVVRIETKEKYSSSVFEIWGLFCSSPSGLKRLGSVLGMDAKLLYEPWVVDSRGYKYWAAPSFLDDKTGFISSGQAILIACMTCLGTVVIIVAVGLIIQRRKEQALDTEKEEYNRRAEEFEESNKKASNFASVENGAGMGYRREGIKRVNTELIGDVLKNITSSAALLTPRLFGRTPRNKTKPREESRPEGDGDGDGDGNGGGSSTSPGRVHKYSKSMRSPKTLDK